MSTRTLCSWAVHRLWNHLELRPLIAQAGSIDAMYTATEIVRDTLDAALAARQQAGTDLEDDVPDALGTPAALGAWQPNASARKTASKLFPLTLPFPAHPSPSPSPSPPPALPPALPPRFPARSPDSQGYKSVPYWRGQPYVRAMPTPEVAAIWARKDARHRAAMAAYGTRRERRILVRMVTAADRDASTVCPSPSHLPGKTVRQCPKRVSGPSAMRQRRRWHPRLLRTSPRRARWTRTTASSRSCRRRRRASRPRRSAWTRPRARGSTHASPSSAPSSTGPRAGKSAARWRSSSSRSWTRLQNVPVRFFFCAALRLFVVCR